MEDNITLYGINMHNRSEQKAKPLTRSDSVQRFFRDIKKEPLSWDQKFEKQVVEINGTFELIERAFMNIVRLYNQSTWGTCKYSELFDLHLSHYFIKLRIFYPMDYDRFIEVGVLDVISLHAKQCSRIALYCSELKKCISNEISFFKYQEGGHNFLQLLTNSLKKLGISCNYSSDMYTILSMPFCNMHLLTLSEENPWIVVDHEPENAPENQVINKKVFP